MDDAGIRSPTHAPLHPDRMEQLGLPDLDQTSDVASGNHQIQVHRITRVAQEVAVARDTKGTALAPHSSVADTTGAAAELVASKVTTRAAVAEGATEKSVDAVP